MIRNILLFPILIGTIYVQQMDEYCKNQDNNEVVCTNFTDFAQLNLSFFKPSNADEYSSLVFKPINPILLDDSLILQNLKVEDNYAIEFESLSGFSILSNPLVYLDLTKKAMLTFKKSNIEFTYENNTIDVNTCNFILQNELFISILYSCKNFILDNPIYSSLPICPIIFDGANLEILEVQNVNPTNKFSIIDSSLLNVTNLPREYDINITMFRISLSDFTLDKSILSSFVFAKLQYLSIVNSYLRNIQNDLFKSFSFIKVFEVDLYNFEDFIQTARREDSWLSYLNINITVDLTNETDFNNNREYKMQFYLTDLNKTYLYPDEDFCSFVSYPHSKLVVPIINTKENLDCTCTLLYLLQYKSLYQNQSINELDTPSVNKCINHPYFDQLVSVCDFKKKIMLCDGKIIINSSSILDKIFLS